MGDHDFICYSPFEIWPPHIWRKMNFIYMYNVCVRAQALTTIPPSSNNYTTKLHLSFHNHMSMLYLDLDFRRYLITHDSLWSTCNHSHRALWRTWPLPPSCFTLSYFILVLFSWSYLETNLICALQFAKIFVSINMSVLQHIPSTWYL